MSIQYDEYLQQHKSNVARGYFWIRDNLPELIEKRGCDFEHQICFAHDASKDDPAEYDAYDAYFYSGNRSYAVVQAFNKAWLHHIHANPHHWQHWVLIHDDPKEDMTILEMPYNYILEMICDWWAFSWRSGKLDEIFKWYDEHKAYIKFHDKTRKTVEDILTKIKEKLATLEDDENLQHHGIKGMKWGVRRTPEQLGHRNTRKDMEDVIRSLNKSDFKSFDISKNAYYQKVRYDGEKPMGFVLAELHNERGKKVVDLSVAVNPNYRGRGLAYDMAKEAIRATERDRSITKIYWGAEKNNETSVYLAKKLGFVHDYDTDDYTIYRKEN